MLHTEVIEALNSGDAWAFLGAGASAGVGLPTWPQLVDRCLAHLATDGHRLSRDAAFSAARTAKNYPRCFSLLEQVMGRDVLEKVVVDALSTTASPSTLLTQLADWPFAGYITTNYDTLLEGALSDTSDRGWVSVGNTFEEAAKVSRNVRGVVWHVHGSVDPKIPGKLVLTEEDYDRLYVDQNLVADQLRGLLTHRQVVFVGFGFGDVEVMRLLKQVGRLTTPARPIFAFIPRSTSAEQGELLLKHNVKVAPYAAKGNDHSALQDLLEVHGALILRRSLRFGRSARECPSWDPETTGLLLYNQLAIRQGVERDVMDTLLRARVLSLLRHRGALSADSLEQELAARAKVLGRNEADAEIAQRIAEVLNRLCEQGFAQLGAVDGRYTLTTEGEAAVAEQAGTAQLAASRLASSLRTRAAELLPDDAQAADRVATTAETFLKDCISRRALGVAKTLESAPPAHHAFHMVALLQSLPEFLGELRTRDEAHALTRLVQQVLSAPSEPEQFYIGLALQAQFGVHLLGYNQDALAARVRHVSESLFLVDSSTLIPYFAEGSRGHPPARLLLEKLRDLGATVATTRLLAVEVAEHVRWALSHFDPSTGAANVSTVQAAYGYGAGRDNAFLQGYIEGIESGTSRSSFFAYLGRCLGRNGAVMDCAPRDIAAACRAQEIACAPFEQWQGVGAEQVAERDKVATDLRTTREARGSFTHNRQVSAEAEALLLVRDARTGQVTIPGKALRGAFFLSQTRAIDEVANPTVPITMRPDAALQWIATVSHCSPEELRVLTDNLLWEMAEGNFSIVNQQSLAFAFGALASAAKDRFEEEMAQHGALVANVFGENRPSIVSEVEQLQWPVVLESYFAQLADRQAAELAEKTRRLEDATKRATVADKDRKELARLRAAEAARKSKARSKQRAAKSSSKRKKKR